MIMTLRRLASFLVSGWSRQPAVSPLEGFFLRLFFGIVILYTVQFGVEQTREPHPVGLLKLLQPCGLTLTWLADPEAYEVFHRIIVGVTFLYIIGIGLPLVLPLLAVLHILPFTLYNSQGYTHHGYQIISLTLLIQACTAVYSAFRERRVFQWPSADLRRWLLVQSQVVITGTYLVSVVTKMDSSKGMWLLNSHHVALDMVKTQRQNYLNDLDPKYAKTTADAIWFLERPGISRILFSSGVVLEAVCIFAIGNRLLGLLFGLSLILMHRTIAHLMGLTFIYNEWLLMIFLVGFPFGLAWCFERVRSLPIRRGLLMGLALAIPVSAYFQGEGGGVTLQTLGAHLRDIMNLLGLWSQWDAAEFSGFVIPLVLTFLACGLVGAIAGWVCQLKRREA